MPNHFHAILEIVGATLVAPNNNIAPNNNTVDHDKGQPQGVAPTSKLIDSLENKPEQGVSLGNNCYKIRFAISSKSKGKSGGARVITCVKIVETTVYLLSVFDKSEHNTISDNEIKNLLKEISE